MHIALTISSLNSGGAERVLSELANYWASQGHQVSLITLADPISKPFYLLALQINLVQLNHTQSGSSLFIRLLNIISRISALRKTYQSLKPDVIISFVDIMNLTALIASKGYNIPVIVSERIDPHFYPLPVLYVKIRPFIYKWANRVVVQTKNAGAYFSDTIPKKIEIIPNAVKQKKCNAQNSNITKNIISIGRLDKQKDHKTLIYSFHKLLKNHPQINLTIYGEGPERSNLEQLIQDLHLEGKVFLPGLTQNVDAVLENADLFVFPSLYEGFPNALCEAMAAGLPVIASNCSGNVDIIRDGIDGLLFPVGDEGTLVEKMHDLISDSKKRQILSKHAQEISQRYHTDHIFHLWNQLILKATQS